MTAIRIIRVVAAMAVLAGPATVTTGASTAADTTTSGARTDTTTATRTVTEPPRTDTVTETTTASPPGATTSVTNRTATVQLTPATTTEDQSGSSGLPWWGWLLIALGAVAIGIGMFALGRRGRRPPSAPAG